jgi:hypothetical protein
MGKLLISRHNWILTTDSSGVQEVFADEVADETRGIAKAQSLGE